jgi:hypothetical protein
MKIQLTALTVKHIFGRSLVTCVPRDENGKMLGAEQPLASYLNEIKKSDYEIINAQEVLQCVVAQYGFGA